MKLPLASAPVLLMAVHLCNYGFEATAQSWIPTSSPVTEWSCIACPATGYRLVAGDGGYGYLYTSTNFGLDWVTNTSTLSTWFAVASSADGARLFAADPYHGIYISTNFGVAWTKTSAPEKGWRDLACSGDGSKLIAGGGEACYASTNSGATWNPTLTNVDASGVFFVGLASSADGTRLVAVTQNNEPGSTGSMHLSRDGGSTWSAVPAVTNYPPSFWNDVACSADGSTIVAAGHYTGVFVSTNGGVSWARTNIMSIDSVACSADGRTLAAVGWRGTIHTSNDSGVSWATVAPTNTSALWMAVACSADGCRMAAAVDQGQIWVWQTTPTPHLEIIESGENLVLSWLVPSIDFVLQECPSVAAGNWTDISTPPTLNYTNIHYEVAVPLPAASRFYRLISRPKRCQRRRKAHAKTRRRQDD